MTAIAFVADVHVGNHRRFGGPTASGVNRRCRQVLEALEAAVSVCAEREADALVVCGDLFDSARPEPQVIAEVQRVLRDLPRVFVVCGNHDMVSEAPGDHALGPLGASGNVEVVAGARAVLRLVGDVELLMVPFRPGDAPARILESLRAGAHSGSMGLGRDRVLCVHAGVLDGAARVAPQPWMLEARDAVRLPDLRRIMAEFGCAAAVAGNWHEMEGWGSPLPVLQVGALAPTGFDNPGLERYGYVGLYRTVGAPGPTHQAELRVTGPVGAGPRFVTNRAGEVVPQVEEARRRGYRVYASLRHRTLADYGAAKAWLADAVESGAVEDGEVLMEDAGRAAAVAGDVAAASSPGALALAVADYVGDEYRRSSRVEGWGDPGELAAACVGYLEKSRGRR